MKQKSIAILCALALTAGGLCPVYATESDEPMLPAGVEETLGTENIGLPSRAEDAEEPVLPAEATEPADMPQPVETQEPPAEGELPPEGEEPTEDIVHVGLVYGDKALAGANLANDVGSGYRFGYTDTNRKFWQVGYTSETALSVVKTQNVYYGYNYGTSQKPLITYSDAITSDILVGCWHVQLPGAYATFEEAQTHAWDVGGFPAWIKGEYQVRFGSYAAQGAAQAAAEQVGGTVVGTSAYGVSIVKTKTNTILFQFDDGEANSLTVKPGTDNSKKTVTHFKGARYYGSFQFRRVGGGNMTVTNYLPMNDYLSCVISQEMSASWPLEALKAQAVAARTYYERNLGKHKASGFDVCSTTDCQAYPGMSQANGRTDQAVAETDGLRVWYDGKMAETYYFASDGGGTEDVKNVWGAKNLPYLCGVIDPYEETVVDKIPYWDYKKTFTSAELNAIVQPYIQNDKKSNCADIVDFQVTELSPTGNVKSIAFTDSNGKVWPYTMTGANKFRGLLGLQSIRYTVTKSGVNTAGVYYLDDGSTLSSMNGVYAIDGSGKKAKLNGNPYIITSSGVQFLQASTSDTAVDEEVVYTITSRGYGHNVGMSQWGAYAMAQQGMSFLDILTFYYPGVEIY